MTKKTLPTPEMLASAKEARREAPSDTVFDYFPSYDGEMIRFARFPASRVLEAKGTVIFLPGRTEFVEKFIEDVHVWNALGFACAAMDLRGQGMSARPHPDRNKHFVRSFEPHIKDVETLFEKAIINKMPPPYILMGHSAGSHVILRVMKERPNLAQAAITVSPMVDIYTGGAPRFILSAIAHVMRYLGLGASYIPGHGPFKDGRWGWRRKLTHDDDRFCDEDYFINNKDSRLSVGGATYKWLFEALRSCDKLQSKGYPEAIQAPVLILQASEDVIVDNKAQSKFAARLPHGTLVVIEGAMHEILKEADPQRAAVWQAISEFIDLENGPDFSAV